MKQNTAIVHSTNVRVQELAAVHRIARVLLTHGVVGRFGVLVVTVAQHTTGGRNFLQSCDVVVMLSKRGKIRKLTSLVRNNRRGHSDSHRHVKPGAVVVVGVALNSATFQL